MGVEDWHISAEWRDLVRVYTKYGEAGFDGYGGPFLKGIKWTHCDPLRKSATYLLSDVLISRKQENLPMDEHEQKLYDFVVSYSVYLTKPGRPHTDLPIDHGVIFKPERVQTISQRVSGIDFHRALWYWNYIYGAQGTSAMHEYLSRVILFWNDTASKGRSILFTEF